MKNILIMTLLVFNINAYSAGVNDSIKAEADFLYGLTINALNSVNEVADAIPNVVSAMGYTSCSEMIGLSDTKEVTASITGLGNISWKVEFKTPQRRVPARFNNTDSNALFDVAFRLSGDFDGSSNIEGIYDGFTVIEIACDSGSAYMMRTEEGEANSLTETYWYNSSSKSYVNMSLLRLGDISTTLIFQKDNLTGAYNVEAITSHNKTVGGSSTTGSFGKDGSNVDLVDANKTGDVNTHLSVAGNISGSLKINLIAANNSSMTTGLDNCYASPCASVTTTSDLDLSNIHGTYNAIANLNTGTAQTDFESASARFAPMLSTAYGENVNPENMGDAYTVGFDDI